MFLIGHVDNFPSTMKEERTINDMNVSCPYSFMFVVSLDSLEL